MVKHLQKILIYNAADAKQDLATLVFSFYKWKTREIIEIKSIIGKIF